jgi:pyridoxal phosphate enzyme (YggS family)
MTTPEQRRAQLQHNLAGLRSRLERACDAAGRHPDELTLIAVTKFFPASDVVTLCDLGVTDLGESRAQEAAAKVAEFATLSDRQPRWHFVGRLQTNKASSVARYADVVHSVDRQELVSALDDGVRKAGRDVVDVLIQVSLDADPDRGGVLVGEVARFADLVLDCERLRLAGVMAIAPLQADPDEAFARLAEVSAELRSAHPWASVVSAGMSGDLEAAVRHGATHVRIGTALLGRRTTNFG